MKNSRQALIQLAILVMLGAAVLLTILLPRQAGGRKTVEPLEISVVLREADSTLWSTARLGMEQAAGEVGAELRVLTLTQANDSEGQLGILRAGGRAEGGRPGGGVGGPGGIGAGAGSGGAGLPGGEPGVGPERGAVTAAAAWSDFAASYLAVEGAAELARGTGRQPDPLPFFILRLGVALYAQDDTFIASLTQDLERLVQEAEVERGQRINLTVMDAANNQTAQMGQVDRLLERGCDVLFVNIVDRTAASVIVDKAQEAVAAGDLYGTVLNDAQGQAKAMVDLALALMDSREPDQVVELQEDHYVWFPYRRVDRDNLEETAQDAQR